MIDSGIYFRANLDSDQGLYKYKQKLISISEKKEVANHSMTTRQNAASVFLRGLATLMISPVTSLYAGCKKRILIECLMTSLIFMSNIIGHVISVAG